MTTGQAALRVPDRFVKKSDHVPSWALHLELVCKPADGFGLSYLIEQ